MTLKYENVRVQEPPIVNERYTQLKELGNELFNDSENCKKGIIGPQEVELAERFLTEGARRVRPDVQSTYWEHMIIAPQLGRIVAEKAQSVGMDVNPHLVEFSLLVHDIGRLVDPAPFFHNDLVGSRLLTVSGISKTVIANIPSLGNLLAHADTMELTPDQIKFKSNLSVEQEAFAESYFDALTPTQRIVNSADNLGKRGPNGLFDMSKFIQYLKTQESRYASESGRASVHWAILRRQQGAVLQAYLIEKTDLWLKEHGVEWGDAREELLDYAPKFVAVVRHGELDNPSGMVYNRDSVMKPDDIMHLSEEGQEQMKAMGELLETRKFNVARIVSSPETRAQESAKEIGDVVDAPDIEISVNIDDFFAPGPYLEQMSMETLEGIGGDVYDFSRWGKYGHESASEIVIRMNNAFWHMVEDLQNGETGVMVSHGDPISWLANTLDGKPIPNSSNLRQLLYPAKGEALLGIIHPDGSLFTEYIIANPLETTKIY